MKKEIINWISEEEAMKILGYSKHSLRVFTMNEKRKKLDIRTKKLNARKILYSGTDIDRFINEI